jgi:hypothetical protein
MIATPILRRADGSIDADAYAHRARVLRWQAQRAALAALYSGQTSRIIGIATASTRSSSGRPSRQ